MNCRRRKKENEHTEKELKQNSYEYDQFRSFILRLFHHAHTEEEKNEAFKKKTKKHT